MQDEVQTTNFTAAHLPATTSQLLTYCVLMSTQPPIRGGMENE